MLSYRLGKCFVEDGFEEYVEAFEQRERRWRTFSSFSSGCLRLRTESFGVGSGQVLRRWLRTGPSAPLRTSQMAQELAESILSPSTNSGLALSKDSHNPRRKVDSGRRLRRAQGGVRGAFDILNSTKLSTKDLPPTCR